ncbi:hypothetical protein Zm00014a_015859 [Zea mays]|uniref:Uncharacterized protein n=2 Tax=Zea mays TaxID=4577 RepID=B6SWF5_MAIZE|nr:hypothetical protein [Zea mays]PWZ16115.1 hypothetical protein Zm00014a_015859 [Zea mays]|eukprot:NP_001143126.1 uncharacterized protein LOC100275604 [Zea mays]
MASPARPAAASVSGAFGLSPDPKRCSFDQALRHKENRLLMSFVNYHEHEKVSKEIVTDAIESCMKKQADNLLNSLEVISGRLSQLELYCYKLERSIGELRSDVMDYHNEANLNFQCLDKQVKEVQKSVQVVQERQELAETQKEMTKLQIVHEDSAQKSERSSPSVFINRENEIALVPLHQVNSVQSPAVQFQSCSGLILQQLVPVQDQQRSNQTAMYCMRGRSHLEHRQAQMFQAAAQPVQTHTTRKTQAHTVLEVPQVTTRQTPEFYAQPQHQWQHQTGQQLQSQARQPQPQVVQQQQQYSNIQQGPSQMVQPQTSSPHAHSTPQITLVYPPYGAHQSACGNAEARTGSIVLPPSYSTISSSQRKHHEAAPIYVQSNTVSVPLTEQHQQFHSLGNGSFVPQPSKVSPCGVASYTVQGNAQAYSPAYGSPSSNPATIVAVLNQQAHCSAPMVLHHLGPSQSVQNHPIGIADKVARMGYPKDQVVDGLALRMVDAGQPAECNTLHDRLSSVTHAVAPQAWSG